VSEREDDRPLRAAFARLREQEAAHAPTLAQLRARADAGATRAPRRSGLRWSLPLAGAAAAGFLWWISASAPSRNAEIAAARAPQRLAPAREALREPLIALGSLRSPTDVLLAPPLPSIPSGFSRSLIPAPREPRPPQPRGGEHSRAPTARRFPA
jgi:hypothetical protein